MALSEATRFAKPEELIKTAHEKHRPYAKAAAYMQLLFNSSRLFHTSTLEPNRSHSYLHGKGHINLLMGKVSMMLLESLGSSLWVKPDDASERSVGAAKRLQQKGLTSAELYSSVSQHIRRWFMFDCVCVVLLTVFGMCVWAQSLAEHTLHGDNFTLAEVDDVLPKLAGPPIVWSNGALCMAARNSNNEEYHVSQRSAQHSETTVRGTLRHLCTSVFEVAQSVLAHVHGQGSVDIVTLQNVKTVFVEQGSREMLITHFEAKRQLETHVCFNNSEAAKQYGEALELLVCKLKIKGFSPHRNTRFQPAQRYQRKPKQ